MLSDFLEFDLRRFVVPLVIVLTLVALLILQVFRESSETAASIPQADESVSVYGDSDSKHNSESAVAGQNLDAQLLNAAAWGQNDLLQTLVNAGAKVSARAENDDTPLLLAAANGHAETMNSLLARGADVNASNKLGNTPLIEAVGAGKAEIVHILMSKSPDLGKKNIAGSTAI